MPEGVCSDDTSVSDASVALPCPRARRYAWRVAMAEAPAAANGWAAVARLIRVTRGASG